MEHPLSVRTLRDPQFRNAMTPNSSKKGNKASKLAAIETASLIDR